MQRRRPRPASSGGALGESRRAKSQGEALGVGSGTGSSAVAAAHSGAVATGAGYNNGYDDENYDYILRQNEIFQDRYVVKEKIGKGSFGQVVRALDRSIGEDVAIKIIKSKRAFTQQARTEIELLRFIQERDPNDLHFVGE